MTDTPRDDLQRLVVHYLGRLDERAAELGPFGRFYAAQEADLERLARQIQGHGSAAARALHLAIVAHYRGWLAEMAPGARHLLFAQNREREGQGRDAILDELIEYDPRPPGT